MAPKLQLLTYEPFSKSIDSYILILARHRHEYIWRRARASLLQNDKSIRSRISVEVAAFLMESENTKQKTYNRLSEILRGVLYAVVVVFLLLCNIFLFLEQQHTKQRLTALEDKMITEEMLKKSFPASQSNSADKHERLDGKALFVREKRALALSLENLEKRLKVLEFRWDFVSL